MTNPKAHEVSEITDEQVRSTAVELIQIHKTLETEEGLSDEMRKRVKLLLVQTAGLAVSEQPQAGEGTEEEEDDEVQFAETPQVPVITDEQVRSTAVELIQIHKTLETAEGLGDEMRKRVKQVFVQTAGLTVSEQPQAREGTEEEEDDEVQFAETPQVPAIITTPEELRTNLERLGASLEKNQMELEDAGIIIIQNGELPLIDGTSRGYESWGAIADIIKSDEKLQRTIAQLETGGSGLPVVMPDITPGSLSHQVETTKEQMTVRTNPRSSIKFFNLEGDKTGNLIAFDPDNFKDPENRLSKANRLRAGDFGKNKLGVVFVDGGQEVPDKTRRMTANKLFQHCQEVGLSLTDIEIYHAMQLIANSEGHHFDSETWSWLNGYLKNTGDAVVGRWWYISGWLYLLASNPRIVDMCGGGRRSVRVFKK